MILITEAVDAIRRSSYLGQPVQLDVAGKPDEEIKAVLGELAFVAEGFRKMGSIYEFWTEEWRVHVLTEKLPPL